MSFRRQRPDLDALSWAVFLCVLLLLPAGTYDLAGQGWLARLLDAVPLLDKLIHTVLFAVQSLLLKRTFAARGAARAALWAAVVASAYGGLMEVLQGPIPGRATSVTDMIANIVGALAGAIMWPSHDRSALQEEVVSEPGETSTHAATVEEQEP